MTFAGLVAQAAIFWATVTLLPIVGVSSEAWSLLYVGCAVALTIFSQPRFNISLVAWLQVFLYSLLFAVIFFGANLALDTLIGSVKSRRQLPLFFHGLEFYLVCCPGIASIATGGVVRNLLLKWKLL